MDSDGFRLKTCACSSARYLTSDQNEEFQSQSKCGPFLTWTTYTEHGLGIRRKETELEQCSIMHKIALVAAEQKKTVGCWFGAWMCLISMGLLHTSGQRSPSLRHSSGPFFAYWSNPEVNAFRTWNYPRKLQCFSGTVPLQLRTWMTQHNLLSTLFSLWNPTPQTVRKWIWGKVHRRDRGIAVPLVAAFLGPLESVLDPYHSSCNSKIHMLFGFSHPLWLPCLKSETVTCHFPREQCYSGACSPILRSMMINPCGQSSKTSAATTRSKLFVSSKISTRSPQSKTS